MVTLLDALYNWANEQSNLGSWLPDEDIRRDYSDSVKYAGEQERALRQTLNKETLSLFERFLDNREMQSDLRSQMIFSQGLAMGIYLGSISRR